MLLNYFRHNIYVLRPKKYSLKGEMTKADYTVLNHGVISELNHGVISCIVLFI